MKIAALSDIHGNIAALDAVLSHADSQSVDQLVNLGDICSGALWPEQTADRLMALNLPTIRGNHERQMLTGSPETMGLSDRHAKQELRDDQLAWISNLPETLSLSDNILLVHGTPDSDLLYFLETVTEQGVRPATLDEVEERAGGADASLILCGHTHVPRAFQLTDGRLIVNPGSVGLPAYADDHPFPHVIENGAPHARYATISNESGRWEASFHMIAYDWNKAARDAEAHNRPDWVNALRTGVL